ncbi:MAG: tetratricopeptide repeat protein [Bacteroidota bacterium]
MRTVYLYLLCIQSIIIGSVVCAQVGETDSLKRVAWKSKDDTSKLLLLTKISRQLNRTGDFDSSIQYAKKVHDISQKLAAQYTEGGLENLAAKRGIAMSYNLLGINNTAIAHYGDALNDLNTFLELSQNINDQKGIASAYGNIGNVYHEQGKYPDALKCFLLSLQIREKLKDKKGLATSYVSLGNVYGIIRKPDQALMYYNKAIKLFEELGDKYSLAGTYSNIAGLHTNKGYYEQALKIYYAQLDIMKEFDDKQSVALTRGNIGNIYRFQNNFKDALKEYQEAEGIYTQLDDLSGMALSNINICQAYTGLGDYRKAEAYGQKGLEFAKDVQEAENLISAYMSLHELYQKTGEYQKAFDCFKLAVCYNDSVLSKENTELATRIEMNYEFDKKQAVIKLENEKQTAIAATEAKKQQVIIWSVCGILILALIFVLYVYRIFLQKKRANIEIVIQKHMLEEKQKEILDSIHYAKRIQTALLTSDRYIDRHLNRLSNNEN